MPRSPIALTIVLTMIFTTTCAIAQVPNLNSITSSVNVQSDLVQNTTDDRQILFHHLVRVDGASSLQIRFGRTLLPEGCLIRMTSLEDGAVQHHRARTLSQWRQASAWFNGTSVLVELVAEPGAGPARLDIKEARVLEQLGGERRSFCG